MRPISSTSTHGSPKSVEEIVKIASSYDFNTIVPLKYWLRSAASLAKEAEIYEHEGNIEQAYLLLFRHTHFILTKLVNHPDAQEKNGKQSLAQATKEAQKNLAKLEELRPKIKKRYEYYQRLSQERNARRSERELLNQALKGSVRPPAPSSDQRHRDSLEQSPIEQLNAGENADLAVQLAQTELPRRVAARKATKQAGVAEDEERRRRRGGVWDDLKVPRNAASDQEDLSQRLQDLGAKINDGNRPPAADQTHRQRLPYRSIPQGYNYPSIPAKPQHDRDDVSKLRAPVPSESTPALPPVLPPKHPSAPPQQSHSTRVLPPSIPSKTPLESPKPSQQNQGPPRPIHPPLPPTKSPAPTSTPAASSPQPYTFAPSAHLENGTPLRTVFLPQTLRHTFVSLASRNTSHNLETCGVLAGSLLSNALFISHLIIPEQISTSDTCETVNEGALFDYVDSEDLLMLGWIHTHPTQSCFMSSRDLHTHCGYQVMMAESIAIVCAPSVDGRGGQREWGCFRLTDPPGLKAILGCKKEGVFHPHDGFAADGVNGTGEGRGGLYTDAERPGHVVEAKGLEFGVVDLRPEKTR